MWDLPPLPIQRSYDIYYRHLAAKGRGLPLWLPEPSSTLPNVYRRQGISIGDVGIITNSGGFDFMFNICLPADHPINQDGLPEGFSPLFPPLCPSDIYKHMDFKPNSYLASASVSVQSSREIDSSYVYLLIDRCQSLTRRGCRRITFESSASEGAILIMPHGAHTESLNNTVSGSNDISLPTRRVGTNTLMISVDEKQETATCDWSSAAIRLRHGKWQRSQILRRKTST